MADNHPGRKAGSPSASGDQAGNPSSQLPAAEDPKLLEDQDAAGDISEDDVQSILAGFNEGNAPEDGEGGEPEPSADDAEGDEGDEGDDDVDDPLDDEAIDKDLFADDEDPDRSGADDAGAGEEDPTDDEEENAEELDKVQRGLDEKSRKAFAHMRVKLKDTHKELKQAKATAAFGAKMGELMDRFGLNDEQLYEGLLLTSTLSSDPLKGITLLRAQLERAAEVAKERYPGVNIDELLTITPGNQGTRASDLPPDLQELVDEGRITAERAKELAAAERTKQNEPDPTMQQAIENTNAALREIGFYQVRSEAELDQRIALIVPAMEKLASRLGLDMANLSHHARKELTVRAGKAVLAHIAQQKGKPKSNKGRMIRTRDSGKPRQQNRGEHKSWDDVQKAVIAGFNPS